VSGPHRDHVIAFARRRGKDAAIIAVARHFAPFSQAGRVWPSAAQFDATIGLDGLSVDGVGDAGTALRLSTLFQRLPVAVLKARFEGASEPARKGVRA